jgi:hypothetical protein
VQPADSPADDVYRDVDFTFVRNRVASMVVYGRGARTRRGVSIGDTLAKAKGVYGAASAADD